MRPMNPKMKCPSESQEQQWVMEWAGMQRGTYPELQLLFHIPNEAKRSYAVAAKLKSEGMKSGVPDLMLPVPRGKYHGLFIEMKRQKEGRVSDNQKGWIEALQQQGYRCEVCKGAEPAVAVIKKYLDKGE